MTKGNGNLHKAGVLLGGRQYTVTLNREFDQNLHAFAQMNGQSVQTYLQYLVEWSIARATKEWATAFAIGNLRIYGLS